VYNRLALAAALLLTAASPASAAEVQFEGFYQMRGRLFDSLTLNNSLTENEGLAWYVQHRFWLRPKFYITDQVGLFAEIRGFDGVFWGNKPNALFDPVTQTAAPLVFTDTLDAPTSETDARTVLTDFSLWRAWGEVHTKIGSFKFGRMPLHWGKGIWQNDGLAINADFGDTADRILWEHMVSNVWVRAGVDVNVEGLINDRDDTTSFHVSAAYRTERMEGGLQFMYRRSAAAGEGFDLFIVDGAFDLEFGPIDLEGEVIGQFGSGDLEGGANNQRLTAVGAVLDVGLQLPKWRVNLEGGVATGDNTDDSSIRTFTFDRDYNIGLFMFEQPMPVLQAAAGNEDNNGRNEDVVLTGHGVSNALYLKPRVAYQPLKGLWLRGSVLAARAAAVTELLQAQDRRSYGFEFNLGVDYEGIDHFHIGGTFGAFLPGSYYRNYTDETYQGFTTPAFGGQLLGRIDF
jgi:hypothetical protein